MRGPGAAPRHARSARQVPFQTASSPRTAGGSRSSATKPSGGDGHARAARVAHRRARRRGRARLRRPAHARRVRRRSPRRAAAAARGRDLRATSPPTAAASSSTVRATRAASAEQLVADTRVRLDEMLRCGTTTCEAKSGYGADDRVRAEDAARRCATLARDAPDRHRADVHGRARDSGRIPRSPRARTSTSSSREMIPAVARGGSRRVVRRLLRDRCVHAGRIARDPARPAARAGMKLRIHADELGASGGSQVAARCRRTVGGSSDLCRRRRRPASQRPASSRRCCRSRRST